MAYARLLRIWANSASRAVCHKCKQAIVFVIDNRGKYLPFDPDATPILVETDAVTQARFEIYEPTAFHVCPAKKRPAPPTAVQEPLW